MIQGRVGGHEREGRDDGPDVPEANHPCGADAALIVAAQVHGVPADDDRQGRVVAHGCEEDGGVLGVEAVMDLEQYRDSHHPDAERDDHKQKAMSRSVGCPRNHEGGEDGYHGRGNGV